MTDLRELSPSDAIEMYLADRRGELRAASLESHHYRLTPFAQWCDRQGIDDLRDVSGRDLHAFKQERREDVKLNTLQSQLNTLRQYLRFAASVDAVPEELPGKVRIPTPETRARQTRLERDRAERLLDHLAKYEYATRQHAMVALVWHTGARIGGVRALDLGDLALDDPEQPHVELRHRRETGTPLKNGADGERDVGLKPWCVRILRDYLAERRHDVTDEHGREPLFVTNQGRISEGWVRREFYAATTEHDDGERRPPHDVRRGSISDHLRRGWPIEELSERVNATPRVIRQHYDVRSTREALLTRSTLLNEEESNA